MPERWVRPAWVRSGNRWAGPTPAQLLKRLDCLRALGRMAFSDCPREVHQNRLPHLAVQIASCSPGPHSAALAPAGSLRQSVCGRHTFLGERKRLVPHLAGGPNVVESVDIRL